MNAIAERLAPPRIRIEPEHWRDPSRYPTSAGTEMRDWALQFLRRNRAFQEAVEELGALWDKTRADPRALAACRADEPGSAYRRLAREVAERFGLSFWAHISFRNGEALVYPSFKVAPYRLSSVQLNGPRLVKPLPGRWFLGEDAGWGAALVFDLRKPLKPQLRIAQKMLKHTARDSVEPLRGVQRDRKANYQAMLRVLDARACRTPWREICATLFPRLEADSALERAKDLCYKARALRDGGYVHLASLRRRWRGP